jgi:hypothetical protein
MKIEDATSSNITELWEKIEPGIRKANNLEETAQELIAELQTLFDESVVIARAFITVPFENLPPENKEFVKGLAGSAGAGGEIKGGTPVLSLIGTHGKEDDWKDRRKSKGHMGIPLISSAFVSAIPMISRLLKELGIPMDWVDSHDSEIIKKALGGSAGLFYVENAAESTDNEGRKIIAAQDFVSEYGVKSVFGTGEAYDNGQMLVVVVFCRDAFPRDVAERFTTLSSAFKKETSSLVEEAKIFT